MPRWTPQPKWQGQDAVLIGGGSSLINFNFTGLAGRNVIGCNDAYTLGSNIVKICIFGDASWWHRAKWGLENFRGEVVCLAPSLLSLNCAWMQGCPRIQHGLMKDDTLGWNGCTGAAAINLALSMGATRVFLLGYDLSRRAKDGKTHWHQYNTKAVLDESYRRFVKGFETINTGLPIVFPGARVINVTDGSSQLPVFPRITPEVFWKYIPPQERKPCVECDKRALERVGA